MLFNFLTFVFDLAEQWHRDALELKNRFNKDFWLNDLDYCALAFLRIVAL